MIIHMGWDEVWATAANQQGLITLEQIDRRGITRQQLRTARANGLLVPYGSLARPKVLRVPSVRPSRGQAILAACLEAGDDAAASHGSASWVWSLDLPGEFQVEITVPRGQEPRVSAARVHTSRLLSSQDVTRRNGIPVTTVARTLVDNSARHSEVTLATAFRRARRQELITPKDLVDCRARLRYTTGWERTLRPDRIAAIERGRDPGGSERELDIRQIVVDAGLPDPEGQVRVEVPGHTYFLDFGYPDRFVAWEYDGGHHSDPEAFHYDRQRLALIHAHTPWTVFSFTSESTRDFIVSTIGTALRERGWRPSKAA